jgi:hypothetical protein
LFIRRPKLTPSCNAEGGREGGMEGGRKEGRDIFVFSRMMLVKPVQPSV